MDSRFAQYEPLRILAFNGGGIRAISSLQYLHRLMKRIAYERGTPEEDLKPCEFFDLIGGTSAGGIIAIMLGRIGMTVPECLSTFKKLTTKIFKEGRKRFRLFDRFKSSYLVDAVKEVLRDRGIPEDEPLLDSSNNPRCRTFVTTLSRKHVTGNKEATLLKTYRTSNPQSEPAPECTIWEAVRATTAAPTVFKPARVGGHEFLDAAVGGFNNPALSLETEAQEIWPNRKISLFLSFGTGVPTPIEFKGRNILRGISEMYKILKTGTTNSESFLGNLEKRLGPGVFFRLNVEEGVGDIDIEDYKKLSHLEHYTNQYLEKPEVKSIIEALARKIIGGFFHSLDIYDFEDETKFEYIEKHHPTAFERIQYAFELVSRAKGYYNKKVLLTKLGAPEIAKFCEIKCRSLYERANEGFLEAIYALDQGQTTEPDLKAYQERANLKRAYTAIEMEIVSQYSRTMDSNLNCARILERIRSGRQS